MSIKRTARRTMGLVRAGRDADAFRQTPSPHSPAHDLSQEKVPASIDDGGER